MGRVDRAALSRLHPQALPAGDVAAALGAAERGLTREECARRLAHFGRNTLPRAEPPSLAAIFLRQFKSPLMLILLAAAVVSLLLRDWPDAAFIFAAVLINALIGTHQEQGAERAAEALRNLVSARALVERDGAEREIDAAELVPGDLVLLESGAKVPADLRLLAQRRLSVDESLLTGESRAVAKDAERVLARDAALAERVNMAFAGTLVRSGRARGVVVATATDTALGRIAASVLGREATTAPLVQRMERFTWLITIAVAVAALVVAGVSFARGAGLAEVFVLGVALAVASVPEGLPVALTVALAVGMQRMSRRNVIVRRLVAVEALGSCTHIASDKTGTLTINQLTVRKVQLPGGPVLEPGAPGLERLARAAVLANEGSLFLRGGEWIGRGDTVDVALLHMAQALGIDREGAEVAAAPLAVIPYEPEQAFSASLNAEDGGARAFVKGAPETVLAMCEGTGADAVRAQVRALAGEGYRVLALADGPLALRADESFSREHLRGLVFLGLVAMSDPPRPEARAAIEACRRAGIAVSMITGDHPITAFAVARDLGLARAPGEVVTGAQIAAALAEGDASLDALVADAHVFARVEPHQKTAIVESLQRRGHFVAVTGDGVNDAPALRAAQVGVAMGASGTDVARETADLVLADDNFASIVAGVEEGRVAYANVRKVIFLLVSTGAAEIVLFMLALAANVPLPLTAVQLLWLNLVTNGIQDVALAFEPAEGDELTRRPRAPQERIFNRLMIERVALSAAVIGGLAFAVFAWLLSRGVSEGEARNVTLLLMVLFENVQAFNSRSETCSVFRHDPLRNKLLLFGTIAAQLVHVGAMYTPGLREVLGVRPVLLGLWAGLLAIALLILVAMEAYKRLRARAT
jgi:P-type Ca2+ transporter type 2C